MKYIIMMLLGVLLQVSYAQKSDYFTDPLGVYNEAMDLYRKEQLASAREMFEKSIAQLRDENDEIRIQCEFYQAVCAVKLFNRDAVYLMDRFIRVHPDYPKNYQLYFYSGNYFFLKNKFTEALKYYEQIDEKDLEVGERIAFHFKMGYAYLQEGDKAKAKTHFYTIKDVDNEYRNPASYYYAHLSYEEGNYQTALNSFQMLDTVNGFNTLTPYYIIQILFRQEAYQELVEYGNASQSRLSEKKVLASVYLIAMAAYKLGAYDEAVKYYDLYTSKEGQMDATNRYYYGFSLYKEGSFEKSLQTFDPLLSQKDSLSQLAYYYAAWDLKEMEKYSLAASSFYKAAKYDFNEDLAESALFNYAALNYEHKNVKFKFKKIVKGLQKFLQKYPNSIHTKKVENMLVNVLMQTQNYEEALKTLEALPQMDWRMKKAYQIIAYNRGLELYLAEDYEACLKMMQTVGEYAYDKQINALKEYWKGAAYYQLKFNDKAISQFKTFQETKGAFAEPEYNLANYKLGYAYFRQDKYESATPYFRKFIEDPNEGDLAKIKDATLRLGDCYYMITSFKVAIEYYEKAQMLFNDRSDHAAYQLGMCYGELDQIKKKVKALEQFKSRYPKSDYTPDVLFTLAEDYRIEEDILAPNKAIENYELILAEHPNYHQEKAVKLELAMLYYKKGQVEPALNLLKSVIEEGVNDPANQIALQQFKQILIDIDQLDRLKSFIDENQNIQFSQGDLDSTTFYAAERQYLDKKYKIAASALSNYLKQYEPAYHYTQAHYYLAASYLHLKDTANALSSLEILTQQSNQYAQFAVNKLIDIYYAQEAWLSYIPVLKKSIKLSGDAKEIHYAKKELMYTYNDLKESDSAYKYAQEVVGHPLSNDQVRIYALNLIAETALMALEYETAYQNYMDIAQMNQAVLGYKAKYYSAFCLYKLGDLAGAQKALDQLFKRKPAYNYWLAKGYILSADILTDQGSFTEAKMTLETIIKNYQGKDEILSICQVKMENIQNKEQNQIQPMNNEVPELDIEKLEDNEE